ncbi:MAG: long-chain-fatty-acid--CoA ligase [Proteobacteria bacterium]|nr:long-chain-fatty-acid--CoA ligase [Pseudomonadota bacterium]MBV1717027.1 long-chain-fatty-acid--CoA ligase [Desulfarculus sp.]
MEYTLGHCLKRSATKFANKTAVVCEGRRITYKELNDRVNLLANALLAMGVSKGDRVASMLYNTPETIEVYYAAAKIGAITVPINFRLVGKEVNFILENSGSKILIYDDNLQSIVDGLRNIEGLQFVSLGESNKSNSLKYEELLAKSTLQEPQVPVFEKDMRLIMYTSGTTGFPKGAMFTHRNNIWAALSIIITKKYDTREVVLVVNPLFHMNSYANVIACVFMGNTIVLMKRYDSIEMMELIQDEKVTMCSIVPTICSRLLQEPYEKQFDTKNWRYCTCTGTSWLFEMKKEFIQRYPHVVMADAYGATEVFSGTLIEGPDMLRKPGSVGKPYLDTIIRVVDENGNEKKTGEAGEIQFYGPHVTQGYWQNPEATQKVLHDGWFQSGDIGYFDEEGYLYFLDRRKDLIISGGENIYTAEIENVLIQHPKIDDVVIIGVSHEEWGKVVKAYVVLSENEQMTEDEVINYCGDYLANYKKPRSVEFVAELPKNALGKVLKNKMVGGEK